MPHKLYHLATCSTCKRIIKELGISADNLEMQDIKTEKITVAQLEEMKALDEESAEILNSILELI